MNANLLRRDAKHHMALLRSRYKKVVPVPLPDQEGCRSCKTVDAAKGPFTVYILSRGEKSDLAVVAVATLCPACYDSDETKERILNDAMKVYRRMFA